MLPNQGVVPTAAFVPAPQAAPVIPVAACSAGVTQSWIGRTSSVTTLAERKRKTWTEYLDYKLCRNSRNGMLPKRVVVAKATFAPAHLAVPAIPGAVFNAGVTQIWTGRIVSLKRQAIHHTLNSDSNEFSALAVPGG